MFSKVPMKRRSGIFTLCLLLCLSSCVSKKKFRALEEANRVLDTQNIRLQKKIDTLNVEIEREEEIIHNLQRDTSRLRNLLRNSQTELEKARNYLSSSKKELNERIQELQRRDTAIGTFQRLCQSYTDSLQIVMEAADFSLGLLLEEDSGYREISICIDDRKVVMEIPESFFFTPNNRNFISTKGKEALKIASELYQKYPTLSIEVAAPLRKDASLQMIKEQMDRESLRLSAICRTLMTELHIPAGLIRNSFYPVTDENAESPAKSDRILLRFTMDNSPVLEAVKKL